VASLKIIETGHVYDLKNLESPGFQRLTFIKRSGGAIQYADEHPGTNTQEVLRALIERTEYLNSVIPCAETQDAVYFLRMALYSYEVRAWRRKQEKLNKKAPQHNDAATMSAHRDDFKDIPFSWHNIEELPVGEDGHVIVQT